MESIHVFDRYVWAMPKRHGTIDRIWNAKIDENWLRLRSNVENFFHRYVFFLCCGDIDWHRFGCDEMNDQWWCDNEDGCGENEWPRPPSKFVTNNERYRLQQATAIHKWKMITIFEVTTKQEVWSVFDFNCSSVHRPYKFVVGMNYERTAHTNTHTHTQSMIILCVWMRTSWKNLDFSFFFSSPEKQREKKCKTK